MPRSQTHLGFNGVSDSVGFVKSFGSLSENKSPIRKKAGGQYSFGDSSLGNKREDALLASIVRRIDHGAGSKKYGGSPSLHPKP